MIEWKNPEKEWPQQGEIVWCVYRHNKREYPQSYQIMAGEVEVSNEGSIRVNSCDYTGCGNWSVYLKYSNDKYCLDDIALAWCYRKAFVLPDWLLKSTHD